jgi:putative solute:sodium symporter small subunit
METAQRQQEHWRSNLRLTGLLLAVWFAMTFVGGWFARDLHVHVLGWPFSFWMGAQGGLLVYVGITWVHARAMRRLDRRWDISPDAEPQGAAGQPSGHRV